MDGQAHNVGHEFVSEADGRFVVTSDTDKNKFMTSDTGSDTGSGTGSESPDNWWDTPSEEGDDKKDDN